MIRRTCRATRFLLALLTMIGLLGQGIAVQAHVHARPPATAAAPAQASATGPHRTTGDDPATCPLCRAMAHAGRYLPAAPPAWVRPAPARPWRARTSARRWRVRGRSHAWRSRGPPVRAA